MPPVDNNTPATPAQQEPKRGFFAKLFGRGKKKDVSVPLVPPAHESQTPPPHLEDTQDPASPGEGALAAATDTIVEAELPVSNVAPAPVVAPTPVAGAGVDVSVGATPVEAPNGGNVSVPIEEEKPTVGPVPPPTV